MKKFKRIFYPIYLIFALGMVYFSIDSLLNMESTLTWYAEKFPESGGAYWIMILFLILTVLMITELIVENIHLKNVKEEIPELEDEIVRLKAKLYDKSEGEDDGDDDDEEEEDDD